MYQQIKQVADEALAVQNKDRMDAALREISALCAGEVPSTIGTAKINDGLSPKALWPATKVFFDAKYQAEPSGAPRSFGPAEAEKGVSE